MSTGKPISEIRVVGTLTLLYVFRMLGLFMVFPVMMVFGSEYEGATPLLLGIALGGYGLTQAIFQIPLGLLSDVWGRKPVIIAGMLIFAAGSVVAAMSDHVLGLIIGRALQGAGAISGTVLALVGDLTSEQNRTRAMAMIGVSIGLSFTLAMVLGPVLASVGGLGAIFWFSACLAIGGIAILVGLVPDPPVRSAFEGLPIPSLFSSALKNPDLLRLNWGIFALHFVLTATFVAVPLAFSASGVERDQHWHYYLPIMLLSFVAMIPLIYIAERKRKIKQVFVAAIAILLLSEMVMGFSNGLLHWALGLFIFFVAFNLLEASLPSLVSKQAPAGSKGTAMGVYSTCQFLGASLGGVVGGYLFGRYGLASILLGCGVVTLGWLIVAIWMKPPRYLTSVVVPHQEPLRDDKLQDSVAGVVEAVWVKEQALLYLKVDDQLFDRQALDRYLQG